MKGSSLRRGLLVALVLGMAGWNAGPAVASGCANVCVTRCSATGFFNKTLVYDWSIDKRVNPTSVTVRAGGAAVEVETCIEATRRLVSESERIGVSGEVCVGNIGSVATHGLQIVAYVQVKNSSGHFQTVHTFAISTASCPVIECGRSACYDFKEVFPSWFARAGDCFRLVVQPTVLNFCDCVPGTRVGPAVVCCDFCIPTSAGVHRVDGEARVTDSATVTCPEGITFTDIDTGQGTGPVHNFSDSGRVCFKTRIRNNTVGCDKRCELKDHVTLVESTSGETRTDDARVEIATGLCESGCTTCCVKQPCGCPVVCPCACPQCGNKPSNNNGCVRTIAFWRDHKNAWPSGHSPDAAFFSSGKDWLQVLKTDPGPVHSNGNGKKNGKAYVALAQEYIATALNAGIGASRPAPVTTAFNTAAQWLATHDWDVRADTSEGQFALSLEAILSAYNKGQSGVPLCR